MTSPGLAYSPSSARQIPVARAGWQPVFAIWLLPATLATAAQTLPPTTGAPGWPRIAIAQLLLWMFWGACVPLIAWAVRRVPVERRGAGVAVLHVGLASLLIAAHAMLTQVVLGGLLGQPHPQAPATYADALRSVMLVDALTYVAIVAVLIAFARQRALRESARERAALEAQLHVAAMRAARPHLAPQFFLSALTSVERLLQKGELDEAQRTLNGLAELLRTVADPAGDAEHALAREIEILRLAIEIEGRRLGSQLQLGVDVLEGASLVSVPRLLLTPVIDALLRHGEPCEDAMRAFHLRASSDAQVLRLVLQDTNGRATRRDASNGLDRELSTVRERIDALYGADGILWIDVHRPCGVTISINLPVRLAAPA